MIRMTSRLSWGLGVLLLAGWARAQTKGDFGDRGQIILSVDRLMPLLSYEDVKASQNGTDASVAVTSISLVGHGKTLTFYNDPRLSFDYTVVPRLTIGGSVYVFTQAANSTTVDTNGMSASADNPRVTLWGIAPRVGYIVPIGSKFAFWPRGGFSFNDASHTSVQVGNTQINSGSATQFAFDLEPTFVFTPFAHVGVTAGGALDIPIAGSVDVPQGNNLSTSVDVAEFHIGLHMGLLVYF